MFCYNSIQLYDTKFYKNKQTNFREFLVVAHVWVGGTRATLLGGAFRKAKYEKLRRRKNRNRKTRVGKNSFPPNPLPFCPPERKSFCSCRAKLGNQISQSGFSSKKVRISSNKHHHIELVASLGASPLASAGSFASKSKGFLKSIESFCWLIRRFANLKSLLVLRNKSRFFSFAEGERQSEILSNCRCRRFPFSITIKQTIL